MNWLKVHNVFHVSMLKKYVIDDTYIIPNYTEFDILPNATYEEKPLNILYRRDKILRMITMPLVKILLNNRDIEETSWRKEEVMRNEYSKLFEGQT